MRLLRSILKWCAKSVWGALSSIARSGLHFVSTDSSQRAAIQRLREEFQRIPLMEEDGDAEQIGGSWQSNRVRLRREVLSRDPRGFLTWDVIRETMFPPPYAAFARSELNYLRRQDWAVWKRAIRERAVGLPTPCVFYPRSSANAIHHAYHLCRFEAESGRRMGEFGTILEFGGGYGSLCRMACEIGFAGEYVIFDLPEQSALQRYYLGALGTENVLTVSEMERLRSVAGAFRGRRLFVATWSLSESPLELRRQIAEVVREFEAFLIAYQSEFGGVDNTAFFEEWRSWFPGVSWKSLTMEHMPASAYLFGVRKT